MDIRNRLFQCVGQMLVTLDAFLTDKPVSAISFPIDQAIKDAVLGQGGYYCADGGYTRLVWNSDTGRLAVCATGSNAKDVMARWQWLADGDTRSGVLVRLDYLMHILWTQGEL